MIQVMYNRSIGMLSYFQIKIKMMKQGGNELKNLEIRAAAMRSGLKMWQIARAIGIAPETLSRKLRDELNEVERGKILAAIEHLTEDPTWTISRDC